MAAARKNPWKFVPAHWSASSACLQTMLVAIWKKNLKSFLQAARVHGSFLVLVRIH
jgi:hypothetical protein